MADWKKFAITWTVATVVGFYSVFVLMQLWNWFAVPLLHVPEAGYWIIFGLSMLLALFTGRDDLIDPAEEKRWRLLYIVLEACVPEHKMQEVKDALSNEKQQVWFDTGLHVLGVVFSRTLTLGFAFVVHLLCLRSSS